MVQDLVPNNVYHLKGLCGGYRVYKHVPVDSNEMLRVENAVLILNMMFLGQMSCSNNPGPCDLLGGSTEEGRGEEM